MPGTGETQPDPWELTQEGEPFAKGSTAQWLVPSSAVEMLGFSKTPR